MARCGGPLQIYPSGKPGSAVKSACNLLLCHITFLSQTEVMGIVNSRAVSHSMRANVLELMRGLESAAAS